MNEADDLRGVMYGLYLLDIPGKKDRMLEGECCLRIEP